MESFSVTLTKIKFNRLTSKLIKVSLLIFGLSIALIQGVLFMPFALELKAFFFESLGLLPSLLIVGIASFLVTNFLVMRGGTRKYNGLLKIGERFNFESENKKLSLSYNFSDILTIKLIQYENDTSEWRVNTEENEFYLIFELFAERLRVEELLKANSIPIRKDEL